MTTYSTDTSADTAARDHDLLQCHDARHAGADCPECYGVKIACRTHQTPSGGNHRAPTAVPEARAPGEEVEPSPLAAPSRPVDRVTWHGPFTAEQDVADDAWTVTMALTEDAARQLARDLSRKHMTDLICLSRLHMQERSYHRAGFLQQAADVREEVRGVEARLAGVLQSMATTQWTLTPHQAEGLLDNLEGANTDPEVCAVGTCTAYAMPAGAYCAPHEGGI